MKKIFSIEDLLKIADYKEFSDNFYQTVNYLDKKKSAVFVTTSTRFQLKGKPKDVPKSVQIAQSIANQLHYKPEIIAADCLKIYQCEGNISRSDGNSCGVKEALLKDKDKCPTGKHRCWASINNKDDELWKITKPMFESDAIIFFGPIRWGQANGVYQKVIERLSWIENAHTTLGEKNPVKGMDAGFICTGHNWNGRNVADLQKNVLKYFGFNTPDELFWNWQWINDAKEESSDGYIQDAKDFSRIISLTIKGEEIKSKDQ